MNEPRVFQWVNIHPNEKLVRKNYDILWIGRFQLAFPSKIVQKTAMWGLGETPAFGCPCLGKGAESENCSVRSVESLDWMWGKQWKKLFSFFCHYGRYKGAGALKGSRRTKNANLCSNAGKTDGVSKTPNRNSNVFHQIGWYGSIYGTKTVDLVIHTLWCGIIHQFWRHLLPKSPFLAMRPCYTRM